jgi:hypothetical protein
VQSPFALPGGCRAYRDDLRVGRRIAARLAGVVADAEHRAVRVENDGAHRYLTGLPCPYGLVESAPHRRPPGIADGIGHGRGVVHAASVLPRRTG